MATQPNTAPVLISPEEYLARERRAETKSEYYAGEVVAMAGASWNHNTIVSNTVASLHAQLRARPCRVFGSDMRVRVERAGAYVYPDVVVVCGTPDLEDDHLDSLLNPALIVEVLSPSTEAYDRGRKWAAYRQLPSLAEYLLVAHDAPRVERYMRQDSGLWLFREVAELDAVLELESIGCTLALRDIYDGIA